MTYRAIALGTDGSATATGRRQGVAGNKGLHGARRILGSVPNAVSHAASCDVLIVATT